VDIYGTDYGALQGGPDTTPTNPLARTLALALTVLAGILIWATAWGRRNKRAKSLKQMLQLLACLVILLLLGAYLVLAIVAVVQLSLTAAGVNASSITWPQALVVVVAVLGILLPGVRERLSQAAEDYLQMMRYLWVAGPRNSLRGEVLTLLERASERADVDRIHIAGFSFGSLVAIDVVFPASKPPTSRMARVVSLATIGCPFDLVRMLQPAYFQNRFAAVDSPPVWINIYDPIDVLGSNFRDEGDPGEAATKGVEIRSAQDLRKPTANLPWNPEPLTVINALMLASLRAHAQYWGPNPHADSALGYLVTGLFSGTAALR
jgi:uncharacterized membrane protein (DUF485 family)